MPESSNPYAPPDAPVGDPESSPNQFSTTRRVFYIGFAAAMSLLLPGFGQFYNRQWLKGALMVAGNGAIGAYEADFIALRLAFNLVASIDAGWSTWLRTRGNRWS